MYLGKEFLSNDESYFFKHINNSAIEAIERAKYPQFNKIANTEKNTVVSKMMTK